MSIYFIKLLNRINVTKTGLEYLGAFESLII
jgi:hypothetical protein